MTQTGRRFDRRFDRLFDRYVVVDWSASSRPTTGKDSIWIAVIDAEGAEPRLDNPATRREAEALLRATVDDSAARTLVAVDAPLGYPTGAFGDDQCHWRTVWQLLARLIVDDDANANNRFEVAAELNRLIGGDAGPFWGCPAARETLDLSRTKPRPFTPGVSEFRHCERWLVEAGLRPASCWQLMGVGSVGSQTLTLLPIVERLLTRVGDERCEVWPFTTDWRAPRLRSGGVVIAETWPTAFDIAYSVHRIRDAAQVHQVAKMLDAADRAGDLVRWFEPPDGIGHGAVDAVERHEGWALVPMC